MNLKAQIIPTYVISSSSETKSEQSVLETFYGKTEFAITFIELSEDQSRDNGDWLVIQNIVQRVIDTNAPFVLICHDDHRFTSSYSKEVLFDSIRRAQELNAEILHGGERVFSSAIRVSKSLFWVESFPESTFTIIFRNFFDSILTGDYKLLSSVKSKFFIYPFVSFSSIAEISNLESIPLHPEIDKLKSGISDQVEILDRVSTFYKGLSLHNKEEISDDLDHTIIPTYIINLSERIERLEHIKSQFANRQEFDVQIIEACKHPIGAFGLWETIRKIVKIALDADEDVILICEDDHEFTPDYSKSFLLKNIIESYVQQTEMLLGGICGLAKALPISDNRAWINYSHCTQFTILYKPVFEKILNEPYDETVVADILLSNMVVNKMVLFPFVSKQKYFGYSDVSKGNNDNKELLLQNFARAESRLKKIFEAKSNLIP